MKASSQSNQPNPTQANPAQLLATLFSLVLSRENKDGDDDDGDCDDDDGAGDYDGVIDKEQQNGCTLT